jgi:hypothetical protein
MRIDIVSVGRKWQVRGSKSYTDGRRQCPVPSSVLRLVGLLELGVEVLLMVLCLKTRLILTFEEFEARSAS